MSHLALKMTRTEFVRRLQVLKQQLAREREVQKALGESESYTREEGENAGAHVDSDSDGRGDEARAPEATADGEEPPYARV